MFLQWCTYTYYNGNNNQKYISLSLFDLWTKIGKNPFNIKIFVLNAKFGYKQMFFSFLPWNKITKNALVDISIHFSPVSKLCLTYDIEFGNYSGKIKAYVKLNCVFLIYMQTNTECDLSKNKRNTSLQVIIYLIITSLRYRNVRIL